MSDGRQASAIPAGARSTLEFIVMLAIAFIVAMLVRSYVVEPYRIPSGSMIPTIDIGDHVLVNKFVYRFRPIEPGDVVVLDDPTGETPMLIKRVIAVGGQTVDVRDGKVWVDGAALAEPYTHGQPSLAGTVRMPLELAAGTIWVMGDNRTRSKDSRWLGPQPVSGVHGRAFFTYWPPSRWGVLK